MPLTTIPHLPKLHFVGGRVPGSVVRRHRTQPMLIAYVAMMPTMPRLILIFWEQEGFSGVRGENVGWVCVVRRMILTLR